MLAPQDSVDIGLCGRAASFNTKELPHQGPLGALSVRVDGDADAQAISSDFLQVLRDLVNLCGPCDVGEAELVLVEFEAEAFLTAMQDLRLPDGRARLVSCV